MLVSRLLLSTFILVLLSCIFPETTPLYSIASKWFHMPDSPRGDTSIVSPQFIDLEPIVTGTASLSSLSGAIAMTSTELLLIVAASRLDNRDALCRKLLALQNETRIAALNVQSFDIKTNVVISRYVSQRHGIAHLNLWAAFCSAIFDGKGLLKGSDGQRIVQKLQLFACKFTPTAFTPSGCINTLQLFIQFKVFLNSLETSLANLLSLIPALEEDLQRTQELLNVIGGLSNYETDFKEGFNIVEETNLGEGGQRSAMLNWNSKTLRTVNKYKELATQCAFATGRELRDVAAALEELRALVLRAISSLDVIVR